MRARDLKDGTMRLAARALLSAAKAACPHAVSGLAASHAAVFAASFASVSIVAGLAIGPASAEDAALLRITAASVPAVEKTGGDIPLALKIVNDGAEADALLRVSCPFANFAEKHTVDRGEGAPSMRVIRTLPIPAKATSELNGEGEHVMLLQVRQKLAAGDKLACSVTFQKAGKLEMDVEVRN